MRSAEKAAREAARLLANATQALRRARAKATRLKARGGCDAVAGRRRGRLARAVNDLTELLAATGQIAAQTRQRLAGTTPDGSTRRVSLVVIPRKGRPGQARQAEQRRRAFRRCSCGVRSPDLLFSVSSLTSSP
jgi:hypothetical protein